MKRLAIITTHPIQYNAPLFKLLQQRGNINIKVFYTWGKAVLEKKFDPGFGKTINWDIPLLEGYEYVFEKNISTDAGSHHFKGIDNPELINHITEWGADAILVYGWSFKSHLQCLRYFKNKIPVYFRGDSTLLNESFGFKKILRTIFLKWVYNYVDKAFYVGTQNKKYYSKHGLKENQLVLAPHAIDNDRFFDKDDAYNEKALEWRRQLNIADDELVFLFAGKLELVKHIDLLITAFKSLNKQGNHLLIVGNGILENNLKAKFDMNSNIHFIDFQNQTMMPIVYRLGDIFILPSKSETWGLAVNEAMACNRPVLVSHKCGSAVDLVDNGKNGYVFTAGDVQDLIKKMRLLIEHKDNLVSMGQYAKEKICHWNYEYVARAIETELLK